MLRRPRLMIVLVLLGTLCAACSKRPDLEPAAELNLRGTVLGLTIFAGGLMQEFEKVDSAASRVSGSGALLREFHADTADGIEDVTQELLASMRSSGVPHRYQQALRDGMQRAANEIRDGDVTKGCAEILKVAVELKKALPDE